MLQKRVVSLVILSLAFLLPGSFALKCYSCSVRMKNGEVTAGGNCFGGMENYLKDCNEISQADIRDSIIGTNPSNIELTCSKRLDTMANNVEQISRTCTAVSRSSNDANRCKTQTHSYAEAGSSGSTLQVDSSTICTCNDGDGCNSSPVLAISAVFVGISAIISRLF